MVGDVRWQLGVGWLSGNFKDGSHCFELCPRGLLCEHFYHCTTYAPETEAEVKQQVTTESCPSRNTRNSKELLKHHKYVPIRLTLQSDFSGKQVFKKTARTAIHFNSKLHAPCLHLHLTATPGCLSGRYQLCCVPALCSTQWVDTGTVLHDPCPWLLGDLQDLNATENLLAHEGQTEMQSNRNALE